MADIKQRIQASETQNLFEVLGVSSKATGAEIKKGYFELARKFHPDRLPPNSDAADRKLAETYFAKLSEAHFRLTNEASRKEYEAGLSLEASGMDAEKANSVLESEVEFQRGIASIRKGDFQGAVEALNHAISLYDQESEYFAHLGWALFRLSAKTKNRDQGRKGKEALEKSVAMNDKLSQAFYYLGMIAKSEEDTGRAKKYFERTLELAPKHAEASSELRFINMHKAKQGGGLKGLFGKKPS